MQRVEIREFKAHVNELITIRQNKAQIEKQVIRKLPIYFKNKEDAFHLDPSYEHSAPESIPEHVEIFGELKSMNRQALVIPNPPHKDMYYVAMEKGSCSLTPLGAFHWKMGVNGNL